MKVDWHVAAVLGGVALFNLALIVGAIYIVVPRIALGAFEG